MVSTVLLQGPSASDSSHTQAILREAPAFLKAQRQAITLPYPLSLLVNNESQEKWIGYENILLASLEVGNDEQADLCLAALTDRFGKMNERVVVLQGMYEEAVAQNESQLNDVLKLYGDIIEGSPTMFAVRKRRVALLKSLGRTAEAVAALVEIVDNSPTDAEAWAELADLYVGQGSLERAVFCLEEVLLVMPNAWNMQSKLGEVLYVSAKVANGDEKTKFLSESVRRFCRSIELSSTYLRGFYGLKLATSQLLPLLSERTETSQKAIPSRQTVEKLNQLATAKLAEITRQGKPAAIDWDGYDAAELAAARTLLSTDDVKPIR